MPGRVSRERMTGDVANHSRLASRAGTAFLVCSPFIVAANDVPSIPPAPMAPSGSLAVLVWVVVCPFASPTFFHRLVCRTRDEE